MFVWEIKSEDIGWLGWRSPFLGPGIISFPASEGFSPCPPISLYPQLRPKLLMEQ